MPPTPPPLPLAQSSAAKEAIRQAALDVYLMKTQVNATEAQRNAAALELSQREAAVEGIQAQYQEIMAAIATANQKLASLQQVWGQ